MKKIFKIPVLLFTLILIVSSCGRNVEEDAKIITDLSDLQEKIEDAKDAKGKKKIKLYEEVAVELQNYLDMVNYYMEDEGAYDDLVEAMEEEDEDMAENMEDYKDWKKMAKKQVKNIEEMLEEWNEDLDEMKEE